LAAPDVEALAATPSPAGPGRCRKTVRCDPWPAE